MMTSDYHQKLFSTYGKTQIDFLDKDEQEKIRWFQVYARLNYLPILDKLDRTAACILEIGCNRGYLLHALSLHGFKHLFAVDLSDEDIQTARSLVPNSTIACQDASLYLEQSSEKFDAILLKAVLEHVPKENVLPLMERIHNGLKPGGVVIIDVPNMDWLFATHERYMDFTHEAGFTKESLRQIMAQTFSGVQITASHNYGAVSLLRSFKMRIAQYILNGLFSWADPEGAQNPIWARSIIGVGRR